MALIFEKFRGGGNNLAYVIACSSQKTAAVIDPISAHSILEYCENKKLRVLYVLNTHGHPDHTGGNEVIASATEAKILAHPDDRVINVSTPLADGQEIEVGNLKIEVIHTPGHTSGSVCFRVNNKFISGDTVFLAGAGNTRFGGDVKELFNTYKDKIIPLPAKLELCPGHDYAYTNLHFAQTIEPENTHIDQKLRDLKDAERYGNIVSSTIGEEKKYNPFFRITNPELIESLTSEYPELSPDDHFQIFKQIRELRNQW